jgi:hypothetical protein
MANVIDLLKEKNLFLEKFYLINENELICFAAGDFENVDSFYQARDKILELIRAIDAMIAEETQRSAPAATKGERHEVTALLDGKDEMVRSILAQDLQLLEYIEKEKTNIIRELKSTGQARRAVGAYANADRLKLVNE